VEIHNTPGVTTVHLTYEHFKYTYLLAVCSISAWHPRRHMSAMGHLRMGPYIPRLGPLLQVRTSLHTSTGYPSPTQPVCSLHNIYDVNHMYDMKML